MSHRKRHLRPYVMRGASRPTAERATVMDPPDHRIEQPIPRKIPAPEMKLLLRKLATEPRLRAVDRCFLRWAVTPTDNIQAPGYASLILMKRSIPATAPLDDAESKIVDAAVRASPIWAASFVNLWYRSDLSTAEIATKLRIKKRQYVYEERDRVLFYYTGRLHEIGFSLRNEAD